MQAIPRDPALDSTVALLREGYTFISDRCARHGSDIFQTRLMLRNVLCMKGEEAARVFYGGDRFTRRNAVPRTTLMVLQDKGSVQLEDGAAHRSRKGMFMSLMTPAAIEQLTGITTDYWRNRAREWEGAGEVVLHDQVQEILCRAVCDWAGAPLTNAEAKQRTREFSAMIDGAGAVGPRNWKALLLRVRTERWARRVIKNLRTGKLVTPKGSAADVLAWHQNHAGEPLPSKVAGVELINLFRPTVAVARFVTFAALALHEHPESRARLEAGDDEYLEQFVQEVRRFYPFFPAVGGRVKNAFEWRGHRFAKGSWVLLDLYGTNHDPRIWDDPEAFRPERFREWDGSPFNFIPQGGGDHYTDHRCPGEWITIELIKQAVRLLITETRYDVPEQDLRIDLRRMPAIPQSRFRISHVRRVA